MGNIPILSRKEIERGYVVARSLRRKLNGGNWVYVSEGNQLLMLSNEIVSQLDSPQLMTKESLKELIDSGIMVEKSYQRSERVSLVEEPDNNLFKFFSVLIDICGITAFTICIIILFTTELPFENAVNVLFTNPLIFFLIAIPVSIISTALHELMHIIFSGNSKKVSLNIAKAVATVPMTHVWTWSKLGRVTSIISGMSLDAILLLVTLEMLNNRIEFTSISASILITRIFWQFLIIKKTDINILVSFIADNPFYFEDANLEISIIFKIISFSILLMMIWLWLQPIINQFI